MYSYLSCSISFPLEFRWHVRYSHQNVEDSARFAMEHRGVGKYEIVVGYIINLLLKCGGALCYQTTKKWWGTCPQAPPMVTPLMFPKHIQSPPFAYIQSCTKLLLFVMFELAISKPVKIGKSYIPQKKALLPIV